MLNEKTNIRHRIGSARAGGCSSSSSSRIGSANSGIQRRASSARPASDHQSRRPRLYTGRPSSAPPVIPRRRPSSAPTQCGGGVGGSSPDLYSIKRGTGGFASGHANFKTHDVSHLNLKVEGKSIRSIAYASRRHQPVNRGSLRVISSHGYSTSRTQKHFFSDLSPVKSAEKFNFETDSDRSSTMDFGKTYTVNPIHRNSMVYEDSSTAEPFYDENVSHDLGSTYTKQDKSLGLIGDEYNNIFSSKVPRSMENPVGMVDYQFKEMQETEGEISGGDVSEREKYPGLFCVGKSPLSNDNFEGPLSENSYNIRPYTSKKSGGSIYSNRSDGLHRPQHDMAVSHTMKKDVDNTSNDGSESTVISLGRRIQLMAANSQASQEQDKNAKEEEHPPKLQWDSEWKQLLKQNHELLLKLSSKDDTSINENNVNKCDHVRTVLVHDSSVQTNGIDVQIPSSSDANNIADVTDKSDGGNCSLYVNCSDPQQSISTNEGIVCEELTKDGDIPECVLEDIMEESSQSNKSTPRQRENMSDFNDLCKNLNFECDTNSKKSSKIFETSSSSMNHMSKCQGITGNSSKVVDKASRVAKDFSCTTDLPTYRLGTATAFAVRSLFPLEKHGMSSVASKDLLEALQMIEDDENKRKNIEQLNLFEHELKIVSPPAVHDIGINTTGMVPDFSHEKLSKYNGFSGQSQRLEDRSSYKYASSSNEISSDESGVATLPVLQVLVEKVYLFTQDLAERWHQGEFKDSRNDLLHQLVQAERLLEDICINEGKKEDPKKSPDLHSKCEEKARSKQEELESRIQKNLELIRKLLDDKKMLTEQCEQMQKASRIAEKKQSDKIKLAEERHSQELKNIRERIVTSEQEKREKWVQHKTKSIKESTYRGLESKMKDLTAKHRDEMSQLKAEHWDQLKEIEEKFMSQLRCQEEEMKRKFEEEKENISKRQSEREQQRLEIEVRQSEQHCLSRMDSLRKQHEQDVKALIEERQHNEEKLRRDHEGLVSEVIKEKDLVIAQLQDNLKTQSRKHEGEMASVRQSDEKSRSEWRAAFMKEHDEARVQSEKELRERLKRQRDKEIERVIKEIKQETTNREEEEHKSYDSKMKNLRERYELELNELESSEREARSRYLEIKSILAQKEEEIVYLRARLHTQDIELCELQHMFQPPGD